MHRREFSRVAATGAAAVAGAGFDTKWRSLRYVAPPLALASLLALAACGGGGSSDPAAQPGTRALSAADSTLSAPAPAPAPAPSQPFAMGVNIPSNATVANLMAQRNFKTARLGMMGGQDQTLLRDQVQKIRANGGSAEVTLQISYQWDHSCNPNLSFVEQDAYNQTGAAVNQVKDIISDFELLNETQLRPEITKEVPWNSVGTATTPYQNKPCVATLTAVLRGMSRAIHDVGTSSGLPLRVILGEVGRDFGFLTYMQQQGVGWDVTGFHIYPHYNDASLLSDPWYGTGGPLAQLASFGRPVHINEFNCGEIYDSGYENQAGQPLSEQCLKSVNKHLTEVRSQKIANVESLHVYELLDEPTKAAPENRFGLMFNLATPKVNLYLATAYAGGTLSSAERSQLTTRSLLTDAQITTMQALP